MDIECIYRYRVHYQCHIYLFHYFAENIANINENQHIME